LASESSRLPSFGVLWGAEGAEDKLFPPVIANLVASGITGARKALISSAGHSPHIDNPSAFVAQLLDFL
jgi:pimeloyl-ACP methyl ester carboxylesterase